MEIVIRSAIVFFFLLGVMRVIGKRELAEMSGFEMLLLVVMGDIIQQGVTQEDMSITGGMLAVGTMTLLVVGMSWLGFRSPRARRVLDGLPTVIVRDGRVLGDAARIERLTDQDVLEAARQRGIADLRSVRVGILEPDGRFTFLTDRADPADGDDPPGSIALP